MLEEQARSVEDHQFLRLVMEFCPCCLMPPWLITILLTMLDSVARVLTSQSVSVLVVARTLNACKISSPSWMDSSRWGFHLLLCPCSPWRRWRLVFDFGFLISPGGVVDREPGGPELLMVLVVCKDTMVQKLS